MREREKHLCAGNENSDHFPIKMLNIIQTETLVPNDDDYFSFFTIILPHSPTQYRLPHSALLWPIPKLLETICHVGRQINTLHYPTKAIDHVIMNYPLQPIKSKLFTVGKLISKLKKKLVIPVHFPLTIPKF